MEFLRGTTKEETNSSNDPFMVQTLLQLIKPQANNAILKNMQTNMTSLTNSNLELKNMFGQFMKMNTASSLGSGTLPDALSLMPKFGLTIKTLLTNKDKLYDLARTLLNEHCLAVLLKKLPEKLGDPGKFLIPCDFPGMDECLALFDLGASINVMPLLVWNKLSLPKLSPTCMTLELTDRSISLPIEVAEDVFVKVGTFHFSADFVVVNFDADPQVPLILGRSFRKIRRALIDVFEGELTLLVGKEAITFNLDQTSRYTANYNDMTATESTSLIWLVRSIHKKFSVSPIDFLLEEVDAFLALEDDATSLEVDQSYFDPKGDILLLKAFLNGDPSLPPSNQGNYLPQVRKELKICEAKNDKSSIDEPPKVKLKDLPPYLEYAFLEGDNNPWVSPVHCVLKKGGFTVVKNEENELIPTRLVTGWRVCIDYRQLNEATHKDHFSLLFMDQMLERLVGNDYYCFLDGFLGYFKFPSIRKIKKRPYSRVLTECLPTVACLLAYAMHQARFKDEIDVIAKLPHPTTVKGIRSFLGHAGFYRRFIKDFSKIARPMTRLLNKDTPFFFSKECVEAFQTLKRKLNEAPILIAPDWDLPFELMCDARDFGIGVVMGQRQEKHFRPIHYASKTMTEAESNHTTTEKEILAVVLVLQELTFKVIDTKGAENLAADHLFQLKNPHQNVLDPKEINETFPLDTLNMVFVVTQVPHGLPILQTTMQRILFLRECHPNKRTNSLRMWSITFGTTPFCLKSVRIKSSGGVFTARKPLTFSRLATIDPPGDIMARTTLPKSVKERFHNEMKFLKIPSKFTKFSTLGASISWGRFRLHEGTNIYSFKTPRAIISDHGKHFYNDQLVKVMLNFQNTHRVYSLQLVYEKACYLPIELEHKAFSALKHANFDLQTAGDHRLVQLNELNELRDQTYEISLIYKEKTKRLHDSKFKDRVFNIDDRVLLFNFRLNIFSSKLKTHWSRPFTITHVFPYVTVELSQTDGPNFKVNGHKLKHYFGEDIPKMVVLDL
nr:reverse transcriptase domain-containing protein [Tanacetum cinerariifolium]